MSQRRTAKIASPGQSRRYPGPAVCVVPVAALDVEVEVARGLEGHVGRVRRRCTVPVPSARWIAHHIAGPNHVHAVLIGDRADAFDEHQVLAVAVLVRHGRAPAPKYTAMESNLAATGKCLHPYIVRVVEQRPELPGTGSPLAPAVVPKSSIGCPDPGLGGSTKTSRRAGCAHVAGREPTIDQAELTAMVSPPGSGKTSLLPSDGYPRPDPSPGVVPLDGQLCQMNRTGALS